MAYRNTFQAVALKLVAQGAPVLARRRGRAEGCARQGGGGRGKSQGSVAVPAAGWPARRRIQWRLDINELEEVGPFTNWQAEMARNAPTSSAHGRNADAHLLVPRLGGQPQLQLLGLVSSLLEVRAPFHEVVERLCVIE